MCFVRLGGHHILTHFYVYGTALIEDANPGKKL
jgi:hypothetical protein